MCLPAFALMYNQICSTAIHTVSVAGLPAKLEQGRSEPPKKRSQPAPNEENRDTTGGRDNKKHKQHGDQPKVEGPWHPKLKAALEGPIKTAGFPTLQDIARHCQLLRDDNVVPNVSRDTCRAWVLFGTCRYGRKCRFKHPTATDAQADAIIKKLEKFIQAPDELKKGERQE